MIDSIESEYAKKVPILNTNQLKIVDPRINSATIKGPGIHIGVCLVRFTCENLFGRTVIM